MNHAEMTRDRFQALAETYGGAVVRWPAAERDAALALAAAEPDFARAVLARAESLDAILDAWRPAPVSHAWRERIIAAAPGALRRAERLSWLWGWTAGAGLAAACAAGLVLGVALSGPTTVATADEPVSAVMTSYDLLPVQAGGTEAVT